MGWSVAKINPLVAAAIEADRLAYLADPEAGRLRYEQALREWTRIVDEEAQRLRNHNADT